jgi:hypothetical protein
MSQAAPVSSELMRMKALCRPEFAAQLRVSAKSSSFAISLTFKLNKAHAVT